MTDIAHIGIAVDNLDRAIKVFETILGRDPVTISEVADQKVKVAVFASDETASSGRIELLAATAADSPIKKFTEKRGSGLHHMAILVDDIERKLTELKQAGFRLIDDRPRIGAEGKKIAFVHPASTEGVLLELQEK
jgi:methylmalonyl-CoA/ethylmalonyl-CoA epimerase